MIKVGLPKGRMAEQSEKIGSALGATIKPVALRYISEINDSPVGIYLLKAPDIALMVKDGILDIGLTGDEWLLEHGVSPECWCGEAGSYVASVSLLMADGDGRSWSRLRSVATPYPNLARALLGGAVSGCRIMAVSGSSEALVPDVADACLDLVETGETASRNGLTVRKVFRRVTTHIARSDRAEPGDLDPVLKVIASVTEGGS